MAERLKKRPEILDRRREVVEHPFGSIKQWMHQGAFLMRGLANVRAEFSLTAFAYNLRRALNILGVEAMTAAGWLEVVVRSFALMRAFGRPLRSQSDGQQGESG